MRGAAGVGTAKQIPVFAALVGCREPHRQPGDQAALPSHPPDRSGRRALSRSPAHDLVVPVRSRQLGGVRRHRADRLGRPSPGPAVVVDGRHRGCVARLRADPPRFRRRRRARHRRRPRARRSTPAAALRPRLSDRSSRVVGRLGRCPMRSGRPARAVADRQMSDAEALMWRVEKDPFLSSTFGTVTIFDRTLDFDRLRARMESAVHAVPRLGWRVQPNPAGLGAPIWADDPDFDIDLHVRRVALPAPGYAPSAVRPGHPVRARSARPHSPAVAVPRRRGAGRRQGGAADEDAPHDHRRRQRRAHVDAVRRPRPATPSNRPAGSVASHDPAPAPPPNPV